MNYSILSLAKVQRLFAVLAILALVFGPVSPALAFSVEDLQNLNSSEWQNPSPELMVEYCEDLGELIDEAETFLDNNPWIYSLPFKVGEKADKAINKLKDLHEENCSDIEELPETVDICHLPQGNNENAQILEDMPYSAWLNNGGQGHNQDDGDFLIVTEEDRTECQAIIDEEDETVQVHIYKYLQVDGVATQIPDNAGIDSFPMVSSWDTTSHGAGSGNYELGDNEGGATLKYAAVTAEMAVPADYATNEVTGTTVLPIGAQCVANTYRLVGYKDGLTLVEAEADTISPTSPAYIDLDSDRHVIVVNEDCDDVIAAEKTYETVTITGDTSSGENLPGWMFNRDPGTKSPFEFNTDEKSIGDGSLFVLPIGANPSDKFIAENFVNMPIADLESFSYDFLIDAIDADDENEFYLNVYANFGVSPDDKFYDCRYNIVPTVGSLAGFTTVNFDPELTYPVTTGATWNASPYTCPASPADMDDLSDGSTIRVFAINVGDTGQTAGIGNDQGVSGYLDNVVLDTVSKETTYDFEPLPTSEVTLCKIDGNEDTLANWSLMLKGAFVETLEVPVNTADGIDSTDLVGGKPYIAVAEGTWTNARTPINIVDAEYSTEDNWTTWMDGFTGYGTDILELVIDSVLGDWGAYNADHVYAQSFVPGVDGAVNFSINDSHYADNSGSLNVSIFEGYSGITGENGCVTFTDVPYGTYTVDEIQQDGWWNISGLGEVMVDGDEELFTVQNSNEVPKVATLEITNPAIDYTVLSGTHTFEAEYVDDDETIDAIQWAIRAGTCQASTGTVAGNVDAFTASPTPSTFNSTTFSTTIDMSSWANGDYCLVVNPKEQAGEDNLREERWFTLEMPEIVNYGPYCGDEVVNQEWEQCEIGSEACTDYCMFNNQCHDTQLAKLTFDQTESASFDGMIYLGTSTNPIPDGVWFSLEEVGDAKANKIADVVDGLAIERDQVNGKLKLAFRGGNERKSLDIVSGDLDLMGARTIPGTIMRSIMGAASYKLEPIDGTGGFPDVFDATSNTHIDFDMRTDIGNDGVTMDILEDDEYGQCTPDGENPEDTYEIFGYVWDDVDEDNLREEGEENHEGWTVKAVEQLEEGEGQIIYDSTDVDGRYSLNVPAGTWIISLLTEEGWVQLSVADGDGTYEVTVPDDVNPPESASLFQTVFSFIIPTAHAASLGQVGPKNFGTNFVGTTTTNDPDGGNGRSISLRSSDNDDNGPDGQVEGASTSTLPLGQVLGDATSVMPVGAPNTGAGGAAQQVPSAQLHTLLAILSASPMRKKHG